MQNMMGMLEQQYPAALLPKLFDASQGALNDMLEAFPNAPHVPAMHLHYFVTGELLACELTEGARKMILQCLACMIALLCSALPHAAGDMQHSLVPNMQAQRIAFRALPHGSLWCFIVMALQGFCMHCIFCMMLR